MVDKCKYRTWHKLIWYRVLELIQNHYSIALDILKDEAIAEVDEISDEDKTEIRLACSCALCAYDERFAEIERQYRECSYCPLYQITNMRCGFHNSPYQMLQKALINHHWDEALKFGEIIYHIWDDNMNQNNIEETDSESEDIDA